MTPLAKLAVFAYLASPFLLCLAIESSIARQGRRWAPWYVLAYLLGGVAVAVVGWVVL